MTRMPPRDEPWLWDETGTYQSRGGIPWFESPIPRPNHVCQVQSTSAPRPAVTEYCACGASRLDGGAWTERNSRRQPSHSNAQRSFFVAGLDRLAGRSASLERLEEIAKRAEKEFPVAAEKIREAGRVFGAANDLSDEIKGDIEALDNTKPEHVALVREKVARLEALHVVGQELLDEAKAIVR